MKKCTCFNATPDTGGTYCTKCSGSLLTELCSCQYESGKGFKCAAPHLIKESVEKDTQEELEKVFDWAKCGIYHNSAYHEERLNKQLEILERVKQSLTRKGKLYGPISNLSIDKVLEAELYPDDQDYNWRDVFNFVDSWENFEQEIKELKKRFTITRKVKE